MQENQAAIAYTRDQAESEQCRIVGIKTALCDVFTMIDRQQGNGIDKIAFNLFELEAEQAFDGLYHREFAALQKISESIDFYTGIPSFEDIWQAQKRREKARVAVANRESKHAVP